MSERVRTRLRVAQTEALEGLLEGMTPDARKRVRDAAELAFNALRSQVLVARMTADDRDLVLASVEACWQVCQYGLGDDGSTVFPTLQTQVRK